MTHLGETATAQLALIGGVLPADAAHLRAELEVICGGLGLRCRALVPSGGGYQAQLDLRDDCGGWWLHRIDRPGLRTY